MTLEALLFEGQAGPILLVVLTLLVAVIGWLPRGRRVRARKRPVIVVDGSNVMHWGGGEPSSEKLSSVLAALIEAGFEPETWFDANVGYKLIGRYAGPGQLARILPIPASSIRVVDKGTPADPELIRSALRQRARIITNDRFQDWRMDFPALEEEGRLISGRIRQGCPEFDL
ncbi:hypothetical protein JQU17_14665 [Ponticoccus sp. SC2-23]|uniref:NYN domain-containing protein n=1 Tax=Alexandriicola marinus TaxID=2081710 RepID=UPI000FDB2C83|nr:hypothetical protein [Alexandriicola marinus]MBM1221886.1 hypothetical protein [Ponticoccus sp. SC6-9]MBM1226237.1 hypothetical protein [Ponticoccus sp. SC6-15]MBM1230833.1 hypothetical protein [Ponticoccus sp. SC6-38]MBM1235326.1 hypothetical protein [Ponticoccus sp. SC6-45]MBM1239855.1 hypothetical protein [Ponticoccus sp. SC6-49]MBM1243999.1 hypothetical protein [Ponticoccus sp. SC2-64]MBM1248850.1 hypothetical protein [Ponticoccus sp. SC6-42]MBM1253510.1 hypothetical protein [Pontico